MASKKEIHSQVLELCTKFKAPTELTNALDELLKPGKSGAKLNVDEVYVPKAKDGKAYLLCSASNVWLEATTENFYEDKTGNDKFGGLKRLSRAAEKARKDVVQVKKATEAAVMADLLAGEITKEEGNAKLAAIPQPDFSGIKGLTTKPQV